MSESATTGIRRSGMRRIVSVLVVLLVQAVILFAAAGTITWLRAWMYIGLNVILLMVNFVILHSVNPEVINQRGRIKPGTKRFDKIFSVTYSVVFFIMFIVAGFDAVRFQWSVMSASLAVLGVAVLVLAQFLFLWAMTVNVHFEPTVRIQKEKDHQVVTTGPYQYVRHPGYIAMIFMYGVTPLILGSWWAFVPAIFCAVLLVIRTALEDTTLRRELPGYTAYAEITQYRLVPGVW